MTGSQLVTGSTHLFKPQTTARRRHAVHCRPISWTTSVAATGSLVWRIYPVTNDIIKARELVWAGKICRDLFGCAGQSLILNGHFGGQSGPRNGFLWHVAATRTASLWPHSAEIDRLKACSSMINIDGSLRAAERDLSPRPQNLHHHASLLASSILAITNCPSPAHPAKKRPGEHTSISGISLRPHSLCDNQKQTMDQLPGPNLTSRDRSDQGEGGWPVHFRGGKGMITMTMYHAMTASLGLQAWPPWDEMFGFRESLLGIAIRYCKSQLAKYETAIHRFIDLQAPL
jgi:hypothetical protein